MKYHLRWYTTSFVILLVAVAMVGCDSNPLDQADELTEGDAPEIPAIQQKDVDISYFEENYPAGQSKSVAQEYTHFNTAAPIASAGGAVINAAKSAAGTFLALARNESASEEDGQWVWEYSNTYQDESVSVRLIAESTGDNTIHWEMFISSESSDTTRFDNYKFMEGTVTEDGNEGTWKVFDYEPDQDENPDFVLNWDIESETNKTMDATSYDDQDVWETKIDYVRNGADHTMNFEENNDEPSYEIFWDTDAGTGYMIEGSQKMCWNESFQNVQCDS